MYNLTVCERNHKRNFMNDADDIAMSFVWILE